jgi:hypothetical protein
MLSADCRVDLALQFAQFYVENDGQFTGPRPIQDLYDLIELSSITGSLEYVQNRYSGCAFEARKSRAGKSIPVPASFDTLRNGTRKICRATPEG